MTMHTTKNSTSPAWGFYGDTTAGVGSTGTGVLNLYGTVTQTDAKTSYLYGTSAAASASGLIMGGGTTANPLITSTANDFFIEFRASTGATSGDNRLMYLRYDQTGAGGGGETLRVNGIASAALGTAHGAHLGLQVSSTGYVTGLAAASRSTLSMTNTAIPANGEYYAGMFEIYSTGSTSSIAAVTKAAVVSIAATGDATGMATVANAIAFDGTTGSGTTTMFTTKTLTPATLANAQGIRCLLNGAAGYIIWVPTAEWD